MTPAGSPEARSRYVDALRVFGLVAAVFVTAYAVQLVVAVVVLGFGEQSEERINAITLATAPVLGAMFVAGSLVAMRFLRLRLSDIGVKWSGVRREALHVLVGITLAVVFLGFVVAFDAFLDVVGIDIDPLAPYDPGDSPVVTVLFVVAAVFFAPVGEEVFYRGLFLTALDEAVAPNAKGRLNAAAQSHVVRRQIVRRWIVVAVVSTVFAVSHVQLSSIFQLFVFGLMLGWSRMIWRSLTPPLVAHAVNNALSVAILLLR